MTTSDEKDSGVNAAEYLQDVMEQTGWSWPELAAQTGYAVRTLQKAAKGHGVRLSRLMLEAIERAVKNAGLQSRLAEASPARGGRCNISLVEDAVPYKPSLSRVMTILADLHENHPQKYQSVADVVIAVHATIKK